MQSCGLTTWMNRTEHNLYVTVYYAEQSSSKHWFCWKLPSCQCTVYRVRKDFWIQNSGLLSDFFQKQYFIFTRFWYKRFLTQFKQHRQWNRAHSSHLMVVFQVIKFLTRIESRLPSSFAAFISSNTSRSALCCKKPGDNNRFSNEKFGLLLPRSG